MAVAVNAGVLRRLARDFIGLDREDTVCTAGGGTATRRRIYLDTTATSLMPRSVHEGLRRYFEVACANSHTTAHKAGRTTTDVIEETRSAVGELVGHDPERDVVLLTGNGATGAINFLARALFPPELRMPLKRFPDGTPDLLRECLRKTAPTVARSVQDLLERPIIVTTRMEHHSNILPWVEAVGRHNVRFADVTPDGELDLEDLEQILAHEGERVRLVAVSGASNVTGVLPPVHEIARMAHAEGARILVDAAQWAPHRPIDLHPPGLAEDARIDFIALSGHKFYAPGSRGVLIGAFDPLERQRCIGDVGGGMVEYVSTEDFRVKDEITAREEAGTPNIPGTIALGMVARLLKNAPMSEVARQEQELTEFMMELLLSVPKLRVFGPSDPCKRVGVFSFDMEGLPYGLVASYLDDFHNIAVRDGCFCAHPYVKALLGIGAEGERVYLEEMANGDRRGIPGMVRASLGIYSTRDDIQALADALRDLGRNPSRFLPYYHQHMDGTFVLTNKCKQIEPPEPIFSLDSALESLR